MLKQVLKKIIQANPQNENDFLRIKREIFSALKLKQVPNQEILKLYNKLIAKPTEKQEKIKKFLQKRKIRTLSGVAPIAVLTKPFPCPGQCAYCPTEKNMPKSYLSNEPAVMRAILCNFNPYLQVKARIRALEENGHNVDKIELIVMGGTWSYFNKKYQYWFIKECFRAANEFLQKSPNPSSSYSRQSLSFLRKELFKEQKRNEISRYRIVGLTLETRPDYINNQELALFRELGCTRVEMGVQAIEDKILKLNKRGHDVKSVVQATYLLKKAGFKVCYHLMPNLPGSSLKKDLEMFRKIFTDPRFCPDQIKIYPCVVVKGSLLFKWWRQGKYRPYSPKQLENLLLEIKKQTPYYTRIIRLIRDIPAESIEAGNKVSNLRQILQKRLIEEGRSCRCIRCREARNKTVKINKVKLFMESYEVLGAKEYFLSFESSDRKTLYAFLRLRVPREDFKDNDFYKIFPELKGAALIRELHTYGRLEPLFKKSKKEKGVQHQGLGKRLIKEAERIILSQSFKHNLDKVAIISGIGVREYYRKLGYRLKGTYMVKNIES